MSKHVIYDIGTEILYQTCFGHNSTQNKRKSINERGRTKHERKASELATDAHLHAKVDYKTTTRTGK